MGGEKTDHRARRISQPSVSEQQTAFYDGVEFYLRVAYSSLSDS